MATVLKNKLKTDLVELANETDLEDYRALKKDELAAKLDQHLRANATTYGSNPELEEYWKAVRKADKPETAKSPLKKQLKNALAPITGEAEPPKKKAERRQTTGGPGDASASSTSALASVTPAPLRRSSVLSQNSAPSSPTVVIEMLDKAKKRVTDTFDQAYKKTSISDYMELARDNMSSPAAVNMLAWVVELLSLGTTIMPYKTIYTLPAVRGISETSQPVAAPDVFMVLEAAKFWAPLTLWLLTSTVLPALVAYFINIPMKANPAPTHGTRSTTGSGSGSKQGATSPSPVSAPLVRDWFMFNIAKGLICYLVYADHKLLYPPYSNFTIATVNEAIYGGYSGMLTAAGIGAAASLYEAVLKK